MKLLIFTQCIDKNDPTLGFFHRWLIEFAKNFDEVTAVGLKKGDIELPENVRVMSLGKEEGVSRLEYVRRFYSYAWKERGSYDAVFIHMNPEYAVLGGLLWKIWGKRAVLWYMHRSVDLKLRVAERLVDAIATGSKESFRLKSEKVRILGHGIDCDMFSPSEAGVSSEATVVTIGRISPSKDYETLIKAVSAIHEPVSLHIVGAPATDADREYEKRIKDLALKIGKGRIVFVGPIKHDAVPEILRGARVFVNMSTTGSLDKAVLEAMACGIPSLTSNEAFEPILGDLGLMFKAGDADDLATRLSSVLSKSSELRSLGERLRDIVVRQHSLVRLIPAIKEMYETSR